MPPSKAEQQYREKLTPKYANLEEAWDAEQRRRELSAGQVDTAISNEIESLKAQAVVPGVEEVDPALVRQNEEKLRAERRADNLRRMRSSSVLTQRQPDGSIVFKEDRQVKEQRFGSGKEGPS
jgi:hypothetical protein